MDREFDLSEVDYVLTTFEPSRFLNDVYYFEREINPEFADPELNELSWFIRASELDEGDRYLLGDIRINYLQY